MASILKYLFDSGRKEYKRLEKLADKVILLEDSFKNLSDDELKNKTVEFKKRHDEGESLDDLLFEAFATVREAAWRVLGMTPFRVQIIGAAAMHYGNIAEMKTGEGKTLTSTMAAYLNALSGKGVHVVTVNEYLASRDAEEMGALFKWLGLTVGLNLVGMSKAEKREQYLCDIMYSTNNELGFDYLRDHMVLYKKDMVQRPLNFAIIDEVDSILIDEARTPLIISGGVKRTANLYVQANQFVRMLNEEDYDYDYKIKNVQLSDQGMTKAEKAFNVENLFDIRHATLLHHINNSLKANIVMQRDVDYVVQEGQVVIVDPFTGRLMKGRQWSDGLHQAIEAKEGVSIKKETQTLATITFQNYFRMYNKLSGMTGTAKTEEEEFISIYNMYVVEIPTNKPVIRDDAPDLIYRSMENKFNAAADDIAARHKKGQPVLVGTVAIETSEIISKLLKKRGIPHHVLNAKNHGREAEIITQAGQKGAVTIATNMAGRGTDIKLGEGVKEIGGLAVIGTERHESRRIDNQLRGRSGRQGDPGYSRFYLSLEDELMRRFGSERLDNIFKSLLPDDSPIESKMISRQVESAQRRVEGNNYDSRKTILQYDDVLRQQREVIYEQRYEILTKEDILPVVEKMVFSSVTRNVSQFINDTLSVEEYDYDHIIKYANHVLPNMIKLEDIKDLSQQDVIDKIHNIIINNIKDKEEKYPDIFHEFLKVVVLRIVDTKWMAHIDTMDALRQSIGLRAYGQTNPLREYQEEGFAMFEDMIASIENDVARYLVRAQIQQNLVREEVVKPTSTHSGKESQNSKRKPIKNDSKVGRNDKCPCGSGKKYKQCCGR